MNLNANKPKDLYEDGNWGGKQERYPYPKRFALHVTVIACVISDSSFFGVIRLR